MDITNRINVKRSSFPESVVVRNDTPVSVSPQLPISSEIPPVNLEDAFQNLFKGSMSGTGEEELLRIASTYSRQISAAQIRCLLYLEQQAALYAAEGRAVESEYLYSFVTRWLELKQYNNSDAFVMRALEFISLRKFLNENSMKVNVQK